MSPSPICYPQPSKARSRLLLEAFAAGAGGKVSQQVLQLERGPAAFYGVVGIEYLLRLARSDGRDWYYGDNAFFDRGRGTFFRFAKNAFQGPAAKPEGSRLAALGLEVKPWQRGGRHIVVVEQSEHFLGLSGAGGREWLTRMLLRIVKLTDRPLVLRRWRRDKDKAAATLRGDLKDAWALVTHASAAANEALLAGIPVFVSAKDCVAAPMASGELEQIESPRYPDGREEWAAALAASQWNVEELRAGAAWRALNGA